MTTTATISGAELADLLGLTRRQISELAASGTLVRAGRGRFDLKASVRNYCESQRRMIGRLDDISREARANSLQASAGLKQSQRALVESKLKRESGRYCLTEHVTIQWRKNACEFKAWALDLPPKIRHALDLNFAQLVIIEKLIDAELTRLSKLDDRAMHQEAAE